MLLNDRAQVVAGNAIGKAGIAIHAFDAYELAAERLTGQHVRPAPGSCRRQRRGEARDTTANNHDIVLV